MKSDSAGENAWPEMPVRTYVDSSVLIAAFRGDRSSSNRAMEILDDPARQFLVSDFLRLEVLPQPIFHKNKGELEFMETFIKQGQDIEVAPRVAKCAIELASNYQLTALDALHVAAAIEGQADEFVTLEKTTKPLCRVREIKVTSIHS